MHSRHSVLSALLVLQLQLFVQFRLVFRVFLVPETAGDEKPVEDLKCHMARTGCAGYPEREAASIVFYAISQASNSEL